MGMGMTPARYERITEFAYEDVDDFDLSIGEAYAGQRVINAEIVQQRVTNFDDALVERGWLIYTDEGGYEWIDGNHERAVLRRLGRTRGQVRVFIDPTREQVEALLRWVTSKRGDYVIAWKPVQHLTRLAAIPDTIERHVTDACTAEGVVLGSHEVFDHLLSDGTIEKVRAIRHTARLLSAEQDYGNSRDTLRALKALFGTQPAATESRWIRAMSVVLSRARMQGISVETIIQKRIPRVRDEKHVKLGNTLLHGTPDSLSMLGMEIQRRGHASYTEPRRLEAALVEALDHARGSGAKIGDDGKDRIG